VLRTAVFFERLLGKLDGLHDLWVARVAA
jgi:hypothetical protein